MKVQLLSLFTTQGEQEPQPQPPTALQVIRTASSVLARAEPSPTTADYLLPRASDSLARRKQWPHSVSEDPDLQIDDMAFRRLVKPTTPASPQRKDLLGKPRPAPFAGTPSFASLIIFIAVLTTTDF